MRSMESSDGLPLLIRSELIIFTKIRRLKMVASDYTMATFLILQT